ncbi:MAG: PAS domain S-box protein [bacterium]|nr:PAS domain S-box protein [bacterium]
MHVADQPFDYLTRLQRVSGALLRALTPAQVIDVIVTDGIEAVGTVAGTVVLITPDRTAVEIAGYAGYSTQTVEPWRRIPLDAPTPLCEAVRTQTPIWVRSREAFIERYPIMKATLESNAAEHQSWASLPLVVDGAPLGGIGLSFVEPQPFTPDVQQFLNALTGLCAQAIRRAQLYDQSYQRARLLDSAYDAILVWNEHNEIVEWYGGAERIYGWMRDEVIGKKAHDVLNAELPLSLETIRETVQRDGVWEGEIVHHTRSGRRITMESRISRHEASGRSQFLEVNRDVTERQAAREALIRQAAEFQSLYNLSPAGHFSVDQSFLFTHMNDTLLEWLGYTRDDVIGQMHVSQIFTAAGNQYIQDNWDALLHTGYMHNQEFDFVTRSGSTIPVLYNAIALKDPLTGAFQAAHSVVFDLTSRRQAEEQALTLRFEQERGRLLAEFVQSAMHDFATPMSMINTSLYLLERAEQPERRAQRIEHIQEQMRHLSRLVDGTLTMVRVRQDISGNRHPVSIDAVLAHMLDEAHSTAAVHGMNLHVEIVPNTPPICANVEQLARAIDEIVRNAILFTPQGGQVWVRAFTENDQVVVTVRDTGVGISEAVIPRIFDHFFRADEARSTETGGVGLGLTITKAIIEAHDGTIDVESQVGVGSTFTVRLPTC